MWERSWTGMQSQQRFGQPGWGAGMHFRLIHDGWIGIEVAEPHTSASFTGGGCPYTQLLIQYLYSSVSEFSSAMCLNPIRNLWNLSPKYPVNPFTFLVFYCNYSSFSSLNSYKVILFGLCMSTRTLFQFIKLYPEQYFQIWFFIFTSSLYLTPKFFSNLTLLF